MPELHTCREAVLSESYYDFIVNQLGEARFGEMLTEDTCRQETEFIYSIIHVKKETAGPLSYGAFSYHSIPKCYTLLDTDAMMRSGILNIQNYPTLNLQGSGVLIGFIDTGIDYRNTVFRNLDGSTRIAGIWDQTIQDGPPPEGLYYGTEYRREQIDAALKSGDPLRIVPSVDEEDHGTFLASIAAGSADASNRFIGAAPDAAIAMVKLKPAKKYLKEFYEIHTEKACYQETDIMLGLKYLNRLAGELGLPLVICIAVGTNQGGHSALSPLTGLLEVYSNLYRRAVVVAAGNEANQRHHYLGQARNENDVREVEIRVAPGVSGFCMELWTENPNIMNVTVVSPSGGRTPMYSVRSRQTQKYRYVFEGTEITIDYELFLERSNAQLISMRLANPVGGIWKVIVTPIQAAEGIFHMWLPVTEFLQDEVSFLEPDPDYTVTEPGSASGAVTVGFYDGSNNGVAISSGRGYTRDELIKPNLVAPGVDVTGAGSQDRFGERTGSSVAAGITAGAAALLLEWTVYQLGDGIADSIQIQNLLTLGADRSGEEEYPNRVWGYGRLDLYHVFEELRRL